MSVSGNIAANQYGGIAPAMYPRYPMSQGTADFTSPFGVANALVRGTGSVMVGPLGVSTSVPFAQGFSATPANTVNGLGLASPFATTSEFTHNIGMNSFGQENPFSPLIGTPYDLNYGQVMATGAFGGLQNSMSPYAGMAGLPLSDGSMGFGGPGGSQPGTFLNSYNYGGGIANSGVGFDGSPLSGGGGGLGGGSLGGYGMGGGDPSGGAGGLNLGGGYGSIDPSQFGGGAALGGVGGGSGGGGGAPDLFGNPTLFGPVGDNVIPGIAQSFTHQGGDLANRYNLISDGVAKLFLQGQADPNMPRQLWQSGSSLRSPYGIFETGVGWAGGNANAGVYGAQASGMAWAMTRNPINPSMIVSYANPYYNNYNFNQGFSSS